MYRRLAFLFGAFIIAFGFLVLEPAYSQSLGNVDLGTVRVDDLSDSQIRDIWRRAESEGLSVQEVGALAQAEGMSSAEASKFQARLR